MERKVGEIFEYNGEWYQCIHTKSLGCENCDLATKSDIHCSDVFEIRGACLSGGTCKNRGTRIYVEIKQNKEDMEEKKLNLKPFDLEAAKAGKPVCTRDGRKARIICFDAKRKDGKNIMALIPSKEYPGFEDLVAYPNNGNYHGGHENDGDLMMLPEKKEGWVNIYNRNRPRTSSENCYIMTGVSVFETKEGAISYIDKDKEYIDTVKIEWEE